LEWRRAKWKYDSLFLPYSDNLFPPRPPLRAAAADGNFRLGIFNEIWRYVLILTKIRRR
jgi:hypothetical protein